MSDQVVDVHAHWFPPGYRRALTEVRDRHGSCESLDRALADGRVGTVPEFTDLDLRRGLLDDAGITSQILSLSAPHVWHPLVGARELLVRAFNDGCHFRSFLRRWPSSNGPVCCRAMRASRCPPTSTDGLGRPVLDPTARGPGRGAGDGARAS
ncbi:hypothetical protein ACPZ19_48880 [Amycolatopsis lurida]